jgi:transposase
MSASIDIEEALDLILEGYTYRQMAERFGLKSVSQMHRFLNKEEHSARVKTARQQSADIYAEKAEEVLKEIKSDATQVDMARARELAQHYRWTAKMKEPRVYGDKVDVTTDGEKINQTIPPWMKAADGGKSES